MSSLVPEQTEMQIPQHVSDIEMRWDVDVYGPFWIGHYTCVYMSRRICPQLRWPLIILSTVTTDHLAMLEQACKMECKWLESHPSWLRSEDETWEEWSIAYHMQVMPRLRAMLNHSRLHIQNSMASMTGDLQTYIRYQAHEYEFDASDSDEELIEFDTDIEDDDE